MKIELILLGIIGLVFLIDFIINSGKKINTRNGVVKSEEIKSKSKNPLNYILKRKKNFTMFLISVPVVKVLFHYLFYPILTRDNLGTVEFGPDALYSEKYRDSIGKHLDVIFTEELMLFVPAFIFMCVMVWFFNDKIKAR
tara:strand:- start:5 stop:424 length:420 start_codon:yes stop_codon:yes gene_type:complete